MDDPGGVEDLGARDMRGSGRGARPQGNVGHQPQDLFTTLHDDFNIVPTRLQNMQLFHLDVVDCAGRTFSQTEFYELLNQRKKERLDKL